MRHQLIRLLGACILAAALGSCASRTLVIDSQPSGASVRVNGVGIGITPVTVEFEHYGEYGIELRKDGFAPLRSSVWVTAPWQLRFPADLFTELLIPGTFKDRHELSFALSRPEMTDRDELLERAARPAP